MAKVKCPICDTEAKWSHQFFTHFIGAHVKENNNLNETIKDMKEQSEDGFKKYKEASANKDVLVRFDNEKKNELIKRISSFEPEEKNEKLIIGVCEDDKEDSTEVNYFLNDYIGQICREERQYALYLANLLSNNNDYVKDIIGFGKHEIVEVFYEATLMRDYWWYNKEKFNSELWNYVKTRAMNKTQSNKNMEDIKNHPNYWPNEYQHPSSTLARWMMNAKPDIAILYIDNDKYKLSFIECKYTSGEGAYKYDDYTKPQTEVQSHIMEFLCDMLKIQYREDEDINAGKVILVQFKGEHNQKEQTPNGWKVIDIKRLVGAVQQK